MVQSLGWEDLLEKEMATHSSILDWEIPWTEEPGRAQSMESRKSWTHLAIKLQQQSRPNTPLEVFLFCFTLTNFSNKTWFG